MKNNKNVAIEILKIMAWIICSCILWVIIFAILSPEESETIVEPFDNAVFILGILTGLVIIFINNFNTISNLKQRIAADYSNIKVLTKKSDTLLDKANRVSEKYMGHEKEVLVDVVHERANNATKSKFRNSTQFQTAIEAYPELKANDGIMELLKQIRDCETSISNAKIIYNENVALYNAEIHSFPIVLFRKMFKMEDAEFFKEEEKIISDEELGI